MLDQYLEYLDQGVDTTAVLEMISNDLEAFDALIDLGCALADTQES